MTLTARCAGGEEARAFQRQQRRAQARWELQHLRPDWSVWESKAAEEGRWLRDRAQKQATVLSRKARDTYDSDPKEYARRQGRMHPSDSDLDRLQGKVKAAADRVEEKRKRPVGRQRYFEGVTDLDPSGVLGRKVQNLQALTIDLQTARLARVAEDPQIWQAEGMHPGKMERDLGERLENDRWPLRNEHPEAVPFSNLAIERPAQERGSGAAYEWTAKAAAAFQEPYSEAGPLLSGQDGEPPKEQAAALQPEVRRNAVQQTPNQQRRRGQVATRGAAENDLLWPPMLQMAAEQAHEDSMSGRPSLATETTSSRQQGSVDTVPSQLGYAPLPLLRPPKRASRAKAAKQRRSPPGAERAFNEWQGQGDLALPPPPPPPLRTSKRTLTKQERNERFWLALRGERPAADLVRWTT